MSRWIYLGIAFALLFAACAPEGPVLTEPRAPGAGAAASDERRPSPASDVVPDSSFAVVDAVGQLRFIVVDEVVTDPLLASVVMPADMALIDFLYDGLTVWDMQTGAWMPSLASSFAVSDDGLAWTASLITATFTDGSALDAEAVERSFNRVMAADLTLAATRLEMVVAVEALDDRTVRFDLSQPFADFPALLSSPVYGIVPDGELDGAVGSGPMAFTDSVTLSPRSGLSLGVADIHVEVVADLEAALVLFDTGAVDLLFVNAEFEGEADIAVDALVEAHYALNARSTKLTDPAVRRAVVDAVSRTAVVAEAFGDEATVVERLIPTTLACAAPCGGEALPDAIDVAGLSVAYARDALGREERLADAVVRELVGAGIEAEAVGYDLAGFVAAVSAGEHDLIRTGWVGLFPSADSQLSPYLAASADNVSGYGDLLFDGLMTAARVSGNDGFYEEARVLLDEAAVVLPLVRLQVRALTSESVVELTLRHDGSIDLASLLVRG